MERKIIITGDGSHSVEVPSMHVTYHSIHGAIRESMHVFIEAGLFEVVRLNRVERLNLLEMGFGTGLNALLTLIEADKLKQKIHYTALELFPLNREETQELNYCEQLGQPCYQTHFETLHGCEWEKEISISPFFTLRKLNQNLLTYSTNQLINYSTIQPINHSTNQPSHLVYFDAFAPTAQPELWTKEVFEKLYSILAPDGILVTYCSKGDVRRAMQSAGFTVEKIPGPPGKREMVRARR